MNCEGWQKMRLEELMQFNPQESIPRNALAKKISMDKIRPFSKFVNEYEITEYKCGTKFRNDDTLLARITPCLENGKTAKVNILNNGEVGFGSTEFIVLRAKKNISDADFIYYLAISPTFRDIAIKSMIGTTGRQRVQDDALKNLVVRVPLLPEQQAIAATLSCLDDKIELNNRINHNLYDIATILQKQAIYSAAKTSLVTIADVCDVKGGKRLPKGVNLISSPNQHPYIRVRDLNNAYYVQLSPTFEYVDSKTQKSISNYIVHTNDVLISIVGTIGLSAIVHQSLNNANLTENCVKLTNFYEASSEYVFLLLQSKFGQDSIKKATVGAVQPKLPIKNIQKIPIIKLAKPEMDELNRKIQPLFRSIAANLSENANLMYIKDSLLPKLISGEIQVPEEDS